MQIINIRKLTDFISRQSESKILQFSIENLNNYQNKSKIENFSD